MGRKPIIGGTKIDEKDGKRGEAQPRCNKPCRIRSAFCDSDRYGEPNGYYRQWRKEAEEMRPHGAM